MSPPVVPPTTGATVAGNVGEPAKLGLKNRPTIPVAPPVLVKALEMTELIVLP